MDKEKSKQGFLGELELVGRGTERDCYVHPLDATKVIKLPGSRKSVQHQNKIDADYYGYLAKRGVKSDCIAMFYGWEETPQGVGLVFERILNDDGVPAITLRSYLKEKEIDLSNVYCKLEELKKKLLRDGILFADPTVDNILVAKKKMGGIRFVIVDGLGSRRYDLKFHIRSRSVFLSRLRVLFRWMKLRRRLLVSSGVVVKGRIEVFLAGWHLWWARKYDL